MSPDQLTAVLALIFLFQMFVCFAVARGWLNPLPDFLQVPIFFAAAGGAWAIMTLDPVPVPGYTAPTTVQQTEEREMLTVTNQNQYNAVKETIAVLKRKGSRQYELQTRHVTADDLTPEELAELTEWNELIVELTEAMRAFNAAAMDRAINQLNRE